MGQKMVFSENLLFFFYELGKASNSNSFSELRGGEVFLEPKWSWLPLALNNPHTTELYLGVTRPEPLQFPYEPVFTITLHGRCSCFYFTDG